MALFTHDCERCVPLGEFNGHDLYYCLQMIGGPTVIARFSDDGPDYKSGMLFVGLDPELTEAKRRLDECYCPTPELNKEKHA